MVFGEPTTRLLLPSEEESWLQGQVPQHPVYLACLPRVLDSPHISQWKGKTQTSNSAPQEHSATRGHIAPTPCHSCFAKACLPPKEENRRSLFSEKLREECFCLDRKYKAKKWCLYRRLDPTGTATVAWGPVIFGLWVFSFTGKGLSHS